MSSVIEKMYTPKQWSVVQDIKEKKPRHTIFEGAIRSGKTYLGILYWNAIVSQSKGKLFIMTGQTISSLKRNVLNDIEKLFGVDTHLNMNNEFSYYGNKVACFGSDKSDSFKSMRGLTAQGWYANEVILSHQNSILEAFARCSEVGAKIIWETNPDKPTHYIKTNYIDRSGRTQSDGGYDILNYHFELDDNTFLDNKFVESVKASIPSGTVYDRQIRGLWKATDKAIYSNLKIVSSQPPHYDDMWYGLDFGYNNPCALVRCYEYDKEVYLEGCFLKTKLDPNQMVEEVKKHVIGDEPVYCDSASPDRIEMLQDAGVNALKADKAVQEGINFLQCQKLNIINTDVDLVRSFENYEYRSNASGEVLDEPVKYDDHYPDAGRYAIFSHKKHGSGGSVLDFIDATEEYEY